MIESELIGTFEVAKITKLSRHTVRRWTEKGIIPHFVKLPNGAYRYHRDSVLAWWEQRKKVISA